MHASFQQYTLACLLQAPRNKVHIDGPYHYTLQGRGGISSKGTIPGKLEF